MIHSYYIFLSGSLCLLFILSLVYKICVLKTIVFKVSFCYVFINTVIPPLSSEIFYILLFFCSLFLHFSSKKLL